jgi:hypothetical protein
MQNKDQDQVKAEVIDVLKYILEHLQSSDIRGYMAREHERALTLVRHFIMQSEEKPSEDTKQG